MYIDMYIHIDLHMFMCYPQGRAICVCTCTCTYVDPNQDLPVQYGLYMSYVHAGMHGVCMDIVCIYVYMYAYCIYTSIYIYIYTYRHIYTYIYIHTHIHANVYMNIHTYMYTHEYSYTCSDLPVQHAIHVRPLKNRRHAILLRQDISA